MPSYLITGAGRGLGLGFATQLLEKKDNVVIATARNTAASPGLKELQAKYPDGRLHLVDLDVIKPESVTAAAEATARILPNGLDNLISNAGVSYNEMKSFEELDLERFFKELEFNVGGIVLLFRAFVPLLRKGQDKKILVVTSSLGSISYGGVIPGLENAYSVGKAAVNMLVRKWAQTLKQDGITSTLIHPGWVGSTGLGSQIAEWVAKYNPGLPNVPVDESVAGCLKVLHSLTPEDNGEFFQYDSTKVPF